MDSLKINTGKKRLLINDGPEYIEFNPSDVAFVEKFYNMVAEFQIKAKDVERQALEIDSQVDVDENNVPLNIHARLAFVRELCEYSYAQIDSVFGAGTSQKVFEGALSLELVEQFFNGLLPFVEVERDKKIKKYTENQSKVMP